MNMKFTVGIIFYSLSVLAFAADQPGTLSEADEYQAWASEIWGSIDRKKGVINIEAAGAVLTIPENFYYLNPEDAEKVLVDVWGNPPGQDTLGMIFPEGVTPFDQGSWAVTVGYEEDGYVSDDDAGEINYTDLLVQMKEDTQASSDARVKQGYEPIALIGWASPPYYDASEKKLHWAKEVKFGGQTNNTLNYNIRVLGRRGVLVLNFIAGIESKAVIDANVGVVLALAEFDQGSKYSDFDPDLDKIASYGLGALVAGKVIAKTGFLAIALIFFKKFGIFILIAAGAFLKRVFYKKKQ
jgi:uncharacterized membrane-anchored protein